VIKSFVAVAINHHRNNNATNAYQRLPTVSLSLNSLCRTRMAPCHATSSNAASQDTASMQPVMTFNSSDAESLKSQVSFDGDRLRRCHDASAYPNY